MISEVVEPTAAFTLWDMSDRPRKCYNKDGIPKKVFPCKADAKLWIRKGHKEGLHVYPCDIHGYHVGH